MNSIIFNIVVALANLSFGVQLTDINPQGGDVIRLQRIELPGGYIQLSESGHSLTPPRYNFYLRDHQGNNRMVVDDLGTVRQINHFYPFGLPMGCGYRSSEQRRTFSDKEMDRTSGLDLFDFDARAYDPALGRFRSPDPYAFKYRDLASYAYCANSPLLHTDPSGKDILLVDKIGHVLDYEGNDNIDRIDVRRNNDDGTEYVISLNLPQSTLQGDPAKIDNTVEDGYFNSIEVSDKNLAKSIFEFLSINTTVEWSNIGYSINGEDKNNVTCLMSQKSEYGFYLSIKDKKDLVLRTFDHSHPGNSIYPSGISCKTGRDGDIQVLKDLNRVFNSNISARIFLPKYRMYVPYNENSNINDRYRRIMRPILVD